MNNTSENGIATLITHLPVHSWYNRWCILSRWSVLCDSQLLACLGSVYWWNSYFGPGVNGCSMSKIETVRLITHLVSLRWSLYVAACWYTYSIHYFDAWFGLKRRIGCFGRPEVVQNGMYFTVHYRTCLELWDAPELWKYGPDHLLYYPWAFYGPGIMIMDELWISIWCHDHMQFMYLETVIYHVPTVQSSSGFG